MAKAEIKEEIERKQIETCSKPTVDEIKQDSVRLIWEDLENSKETVDQYQVRYRIKKDGNGKKWKFMFSEDKRNNTVISGLRSDTTYEFQVRPVYDDTEAPYSIVSDPVNTRPSLASKMLKSSTKISDSDPNNIAVYRLNSNELTDARNTTAKTRKVVLGEENKFITKEKNLMLVGATGNGKSTLVDALVNHLMGVSFDDPFRFKLVSLEQEEDRQSNQALSQTEWVTSYIIHPDTDGRYDFKINIIDTPGFGDTRGIGKDTDIVRQIKVLFSDEAPKGLAFLDAVCFLVKAPDARLTVTQKYIFQSIMSLFGNDISQNICTLITFADGDNSPVESALKESGLPFGEKFRFNNSGLFASNENLSSDSLLPKFWSMGHKSFKSLFEHIENFETKSLTMTKEVLEQREFLQSTVDNLQPQVNEGLHKLNELRNEINILQGHKTDIESNKDFEYTVDEIQQQLIDLQVGHYVTNCLTCNRTCHKDCRIPDDDQKASCCVMDKTGHCNVCPGKCYWKQHKNTGYIIDFQTKKVTKTYKEKLQKFEEATGSILTHEKLIITMWEDLGKLFLQIEGMMADVNECRGKLKEIALVPDILSMPEQIDLMIQTEKMDKIPGFDERIKMLSGMKKKAEIHKGVDEFRADLKNIETEMKKQISDATLSDDGVQKLERWFSEWLDFS